MTRSRTALATLLAAMPAVAQASTITEERIRETVTWLAADERAGRAMGSPELVAAGEWIAARFAAAGLQQVTADSWYHTFPFRGAQLDSAAVKIVLTRKDKDDKVEVELVADKDVRQWLPSDATSGTDEGVTVAGSDDPALQQMLFADSARRLVVVEVKEDHPYWQRSAGKHTVLRSRRQGSRPVLLVREGLLPAGGGTGWTATWSVPQPEYSDLPQHNVVAAVRGKGLEDDWVVVSAHYDHLGVWRPYGGDAIYNGADDNASGTTAVILLAEALAKMPAPRRSVMFVCFTGEERNLLGSSAFAEKPPVPLERIAANVNIEMIGRPDASATRRAWITGAELSDLAAIAGPALQRGGVELTTHRMASMLFAASDNWPLAVRGVVAHSLSAGSGLHRDYHKPSDEVGKLDIPHMTAVVRGLLELMVELANRDTAPQWNDQGKARIGDKRR